MVEDQVKEAIGTLRFCDHPRKKTRARKGKAVHVSESALRGVDLEGLIASSGEVLVRCGQKRNHHLASRGSTPVTGEASSCEAWVSRAVTPVCDRMRLSFAMGILRLRPSPLLPFAMLSPPAYRDCAGAGLARVFPLKSSGLGDQEENASFVLRMCYAILPPAPPSVDHRISKRKCCSFWFRQAVGRNHLR